MRLPSPRNFFILCGLLLLCISIVLLGLCVYSLNSDSVVNRIDSYEINKGQSVVKVAQELDDLQVLDNALVTILIMKIFNLGNKIQAGIYEFNVGDSRWEVLQKITRGQQKLLQTTFLEGFTYKQIKSNLEASRYLKIDVCDLALIKSFFNFNPDSMEGLFFPDTYFYNANTRTSDILLLASKKMASILDTEWGKRSNVIDGVIRNPYEALILASIVEREAVLNEEKPLIAGVFIKRLLKNMRLQADPTVIYAIGDNYDGNIKRAHLKIDSPYNTYRQKGLPPTPIGSPGLNALRAVMNPNLSDYLYFVAKNDGSHKFSRTLKEHNNAVNYYQKKKRK